MKPVPQTVLYGEHAIGNGNCVDACIASLLELPLWAVPSFHQMWGRPDRTTRMHDWFDRLGLEQVWCAPDTPVDKLPEFYMVSGPSPRGNTGHAVVYRRGELAHDPHHTQQGVQSVGSIFYFLKVGEVPRWVPLSSYLLEDLAC